MKIFRNRTVIGVLCILLAPVSYTHLDVYKRQLYTMGDIARCSIGQPTDYHNEELLYKLFGVNAEPVSYTHLDVYKRQHKKFLQFACRKEQ